MEDIITYKVGENEITLTNQVIRSLTNGNDLITNAEIGLFMALCKDSKLNPFTREAYLIKYDDKAPAQIVVSLNAFSRLADENPKYAGMEDGIIVQTSDNNIVDRIGCVLYPGEKLIGGWAKVYRSDRQVPSIARLSLNEYNTYKSNWKSKPATMINKCAKVSALRKAFPQSFNNCYAEEELQKSQEPENNNVYEFTSETETEKEFTIKDDVIIENVTVSNIVTNESDVSETDVPEIDISDCIYIPYTEYKNNKDMYESVKLPNEQSAYNSVTKNIRVRKKQ